MNNSLVKKVTREKHLDHMVKVVPFIVFCYGVHSYILLGIIEGNSSMKGILLLGGLLASMISLLVYYDIKHQIELDHEVIRVSFLGFEKKISYEDILTTEVVSPQETFSTLKIRTTKGTFHFYFIDEAEKIKDWIIQKQSKEEKEAA
jgi:hypothetical protein